MMSLRGDSKASQLVHVAILVLMLLAPVVGFLRVSGGRGRLLNSPILPIRAAKFDVQVIPEFGKCKTVKQLDSDYSLLANIQAKGISAPNSCNAGSCNACAARFEVEGDADISEVIAAEVEFSDKEVELMKRGLLLTCTTRCIGPGLKIELGAEEDV